MAQFTQADLVYQGAFKVPAGNPGGGGQAGAYAYPQGPIEYNPANNSLYYVGHTYDQRVAEIAIPVVVNSTTLADLNTATIIQHLVDPLEGQRDEVNPTHGTNQIGGMLIYGGELHITAYTYYDAGYSAVKSHFKRPLNLSTTGEVVGAVRVNGDLNPGFVDGYMCQVPAAHQAAIGKPALTGNNSLSIIHRTSWGPAAFGFDPAAVGVTEPVPVTNLVYYDQFHTTLGTTAQTDPVWNATTLIKGILFPAGYESVLFFGKHGIGPYCYGDGTVCNDPSDGSQGTHAYPYVHQVWSYDVADLAAVKAGTKNPWEPLPTVWTFDLPFQTSSRKLGSCAYDSANNLVYLVQMSAAGNGYPLIHVFEVAGTPPTPAATITRSLATVRAGATNTVTWADIGTPAVGDLVGLFTAGASNDAPIEWFYLDNTKVEPGAPVGAAGNFAFTIPRRTRSGTYEFRLATKIETDDGLGNITTSNSLMATSASFTVQGKKVSARV